MKVTSQHICSSLIKRNKEELKTSVQEPVKSTYGCLAPLITVGLPIVDSIMYQKLVAIRAIIRVLDLSINR